MTADPVSAFLSSRTRLKIADLLSTRPRTLGELAELTGVSIQGVLRHLRKLVDLGLVEERGVKGKGVTIRKVYLARGIRVGDFSVGDLTVVKLSRADSRSVDSTQPVVDLEYLAEEALLQRRRIRDQAKKLGRMIDELVDEEAKMNGLLHSLDLTESERLVLQTLFTEDSIAEGERALSAHYGLKDGRRSIEKALAKARRSGKR
ncbi:MAG: helix-turn-helix domain-containing protein [Thaumarchaeota archaeon]|nr:helix-turn-helix domain-containing protein [Nitrososphaerota archaeon]